MPSTKSTIDYLVEQLAGAGDIRSRAMFGEYALYCDDKVIALVCDDQLFMKITAISAPYLDSSHEAPPYPGAKNYLLVPGDKWDNREWLRDFARDTAAALPKPKPKRKP